MTWTTSTASRINDRISSGTGKPMQISANINRSRRTSSLTSRPPRRRQREGNDIVAPWRIQNAVPAGRDDNELPLVAARAIGHRSRLSAGREAMFPQFAPGLDVEGPKIAVHRCSDKDQVAGGGDGSAHIGHPEIPRRREPGANARGRTQGYLPHYTIAAQVDAHKGTPRRGRAG